MKKFLLTILSAICIVLGVCFVGCDKKDSTPPTTYSYFGVVQTLDDNDGLYVYIPEFGICEFPTVAEGKEPDLIIKDGDLISMEFSSEIQVTKSYPAIIATPAQNISVWKNNVGLEATDKAYLLTIDYTQEMKNEVLTYDKHIGDNVYFWRYEGVPSPNGGVVQVEDYAMAIIKNMTDDSLTLGLSLEQNMQEFFKYFVSDGLEMKGQKTDGSQEECFCNFFDIQSSLEITDIQRIVKAREVYISNSTTRCPSEYKTSALEQDIENVYRWLKYTLINSLIREISPSEISNTFGDAYEMTVYTSRGDFKIQQIAWGYFKIWDKYYVMDRGTNRDMPTIECNDPYYKFDYSTERTVDFYNFENFEAQYDIKLSEMSLKKASWVADMHPLGFFLNTDVGVIELYSNKTFYHEGTGYYEIIGNEDFSSIFDANSELVKMISKNYQLIKAIYARDCCVEHPDDKCFPEVWNYYGEFESGAIVAGVYCTNNWGDNTPYEPSSEVIAGQEFPYGTDYVTVFYDGERYSLAAAYESGYLTQSDIASVAIRMGDVPSYIIKGDNMIDDINNVLDDYLSEVK